jgi:hypothetical protein
MATGVMSSGGGAGVSAKIAVRGLALKGGKRYESASRNRQKTLANFARFSNVGRAAIPPPAAVPTGIRYSKKSNNYETILIRDFGPSGTVARPVPPALIPQRKIP